MQKKVISLASSVALVSILGVSNLSAKDGLYVGVGIGSTTMDETTETYHNIAYSNTDSKTEYEAGITSSFKLGYKKNKIRFDLERMTHTNEIETMRRKSNNIVFTNVNETSETKVTSTFVNVYYDLTSDEKKKLVPYVGFGIGKTTLDVTRKYNLTTLDQSSSVDVSSWHLSAGADFKINDNLVCDINYKMINYEDAVLTDMDGDKLDQEYSLNHSITVGLRYTF